MRIPGQRQQISSQIDQKNRNIGTVYSPNSKYYSFEERKKYWMNHIRDNQNGQ